MPASKSRTRAFSKCSGHTLGAAGGGIHERVITADGTIRYEAVARGQQKRHQRADGTRALYAKHRFHCPETDQHHQWWESLTATKEDAAAKFNRAEYLRTVPRNDPDYHRIYGMRSDTESLHAQLEYAFHKQRLPAWGAHRQTLVVLFAALAQNSWARHVWQREAAHQQAPPRQAA